MRLAIREPKWAPRAINFFADKLAKTTIKILSVLVIDGGLNKWRNLRNMQVVTRKKKQLRTFSKGKKRGGQNKTKGKKHNTKQTNGKKKEMCLQQPLTNVSAIVQVQI